MSKLLKILGIIGFVAVTCLSQHGTASADDGPFTCSSSFFQVISGQLKSLNPVTGAYTNIGSNAGFDYNAIGYNVLDNYIYGIIHNGANSGDLVRIGSDGTTTDLGLPAGLPRATYVNGSFDLAGNLYINGPSQTVYKVNVSTMTATTLTITGDAIVDGFDNVVIGNNMYLLVGDTLSVVNLNTDVDTNVTVSGPAGWLTAGGDFGAGWSDQAGELFFSNNETGSIYQISDLDSPTPTATFKVTGTVTSDNDGTDCSLAAQSPFDPPVAINDSYTTTYNTPLKETTTPLLSNDIGNSLTVTSNTNPAHGTVSVNPDGTFSYTPARGFSGTDSFGYTVTDAYGRTASATVTITVSPAAKAPDTGFGEPEASSAWVMIGMRSALSVILTVLGLRLWKNFRTSSK